MKSMARQQLPRLAIDAAPYTPEALWSSPSSSVSSSSAQGSVATSVFTPSPYSAGGIQVLCLYDFDTTEPDQLSFRRNEVLDVVKQEASGWWAALRQSDGAVGWIPSAYVELISEQAARARGHKIHIRVNTERLHPPILDERSSYLSTADEIRGYEWLPLSDTAKTLSHMTSPLHFPNDVSSAGAHSPLVAPEDDYPGSQLITVPDSTRIRAACPPSPSTPMPKPPLQLSLNIGPRSAPVGVSSSNSLPPQSQSPTIAPSPGAAPSHARQFRRRPVLIDDSTSLNRLSTLFETSDATELDFLVTSPVLADAMDVYPRAARVDKVKQITGDDDAQALYSAKIAHSALPWYLKPDHGDSEIRVEYDGMITSGTLPALVERLTVEHFTPAQEKRYRHTFLMTYRTFCTAQDLFGLLLSRYDMKPPLNLTPEELEVWKQKRLRTTQRRVLATFSSWLEHHRLLEDEPAIVDQLEHFLLSINSPTGNKVTAKQVLKTMERLASGNADDSENTSPPDTKHRRKTSSKDELHRMDAGLIAEHICLYERRLYARIVPQDCVDYVLQRQASAAPRLVAFCKTHDRLANWVKFSILSVEHVGKRAQTVDFWIKVAEKCRAINALSSLSAIVAALTSTALTRLNLTWAHVDRSDNLEPLSEFSDPLNGFPHYRSVQQETEDPCVPFIVMYLTDLTHVNEDFPDSSLDDGKKRSDMINFVKRVQFAEVVETMLRHQSRAYSFQNTEDPVLSAYIQWNLSQATEMDEAALWKMSEELHRAELVQMDLRRGLEAAGF
ncbi:ras GEF [Cristinia sonorae]|uniref:Ras GEF n=1 Tax=Cristinia sonorae TaxID=1940300 RepID=A0A8K0XP51_9AGAR|nr:ras GEF [Cristinia sonorae]